MNRHLKTAVAALLPVVMAAGCTDFLKCTECVTNPNDPTASTVSQRFVSVEANYWQYVNGDVDRLVSMWMQSMAGTDRQYESLGIYQITQASEDGEFQRPYGGGGLIDIRYITDQEGAAGDQTFVGIAQIYQAMFMGMTADIWGDIPYTQAAKPDSFQTPQYDAQQVVYDSLQNLLSAAIANLQAGVGPGPGKVDLVYGADTGSVQRADWIALAHTLKARLYLHTAEVDGASAYTAALAEANLGVGMAANNNAQDYTIPYTSTANQQNNWYQFMVVQRSGYISAGSYMVELLKANGDPRLDEYYAAAAGQDTIFGNDPGTGITPKTGTLSDLRLAPDYAQPIVTYNENLLIKAEAQYQTGDEAGALLTLNQEIAAWANANFGNKSAWHTGLSVAPAGALTGQALLDAIMTEKYITLFQNVESWNDYKRTCIPALTPAASKTELPPRLLYGSTEASTNPNAPADPPRNWNDPNGCGG